MEKETKYCITAIIIAVIWFLAQPIGGNTSIEANFDKVPYFNLTNSTISGSIEISGYMPIGVLLPMFVVEIISELNVKVVLFLIGIIIALALIFSGISDLYKNRRK